MQLFQSIRCFATVTLIKKKNFLWKYLSTLPEKFDEYSFSFELKTGYCCHGDDEELGILLQVDGAIRSREASGNSTSVGGKSELHGVAGRYQRTRRELITAQFHWDFDSVTEIDFQTVPVASGMILHSEVDDGELDSTTSLDLDLVDAVQIVAVVLGVVRCSHGAPASSEAATAGPDEFGDGRGRSGGWSCGRGGCWSCG